eukprot:354575-Chlamydomonas_euryale.AAC.17
MRSGSLLEGRDGWVWIAACGCLVDRRSVGEEGLLEHAMCPHPFLPALTPCDEITNLFEPSSPDHSAQLSRNP